MLPAAAIFSDTWNYRIKTFPVTRELLSPLALVLLMPSPPTSVSRRTWKLHPRLFSPREKEPPPFSSRRELSRATTACGNNFRDFPAVARALCRETINFFLLPSSILAVEFSFSPLSLFLSLFFLCRSATSRKFGRSQHSLSDFVPQRFHRNSRDETDFFVYSTREKFTYTKEDARSCRQSRNFLGVPYAKCMTRYFSVSPYLVFFAIRISNSFIKEI